MPYTKISLEQGLYTEDTRVGSSNRWINGNHMRFVTDVPQKIGGWTKFSQQQFSGICRGMQDWSTVDGQQYLGFGTNTNLYVTYQGTYWDITPYTTGGTLINPFTTTMSSMIVNVLSPGYGQPTGTLVLFQNVVPFAGITVTGPYPITVVDANNYTINVGTAANASVTGGGNPVLYAFYGTLTNPFTTVDGSNIVTVSQAAHNLQIGTVVNFINASTVGGLTLNGTWVVSNIVDPNNYQFIANALATSSTTGGGTVNYLYELTAGSVNVNVGFGYGVGAYGAGSYGTPRTDQGVIIDYPRIWSMDIFRDNLIASPRDGGIYFWPFQETNPITNHAALITGAPAQNKYVLMWPDSETIMSFGCTNTLGIYNPLNIRWCNNGFYSDWVVGPTATKGSTAGQQELSGGNTVLGAIKMRGQVLLATDTNLFAVYADPVLGFSFFNVGNVNLVSPKAMIEANGVVFMFGYKQFYMFDGTLQVLKCDVRRHVFEDINVGQIFKTYGVINSEYNEVTWFYPSLNSLEVNRYVTFNWQKAIWSFGSMDRTSGVDIGPVSNYPIYAGSDGYLYYHEFGWDADGKPLYAFLESGDIMIENRNRFVYVKNLVPDILESNRIVTLTVTTQRFPETYTRVFGPYTIDPGSPPVLDEQGNIITPPIAATDVIGTRIKGGQFSFTWTSNQKGATFEVGDLELEYLPVGTK